MRIAVSGTHCSGKSTLIEDFLSAHPEYVHEPEPYEWLEALHGAAAEHDFCAQLELSAERLRSYAPGANVIAERCPLDFIAYILALEEPEMHDSHIEAATSGMAHVDLLVILPLDDTTAAPADENPELREGDERAIARARGER